MKRNRPKAFTLVELLVVIAIIGILVALLLPAIQASRESARRTQCTSQISQLILALHDYEASHEHYPSGTIDKQGPIKNLPVGNHISWIASILPFIEEGVLYNKLDTSLGAYNYKNDRVRQVTIPLLICPSCPANDWPYSNYAGCHHDTEAPIDVTNRGVLFLNSQITRDDLKDGAAYTLFLGEKVPDDYDLGWLSGTPATLRNTGSPLNKNRGSWGSGSAPPWVYSYPPSDSRWQWGNQQIDPISGKLVTVEPDPNAPVVAPKGATAENPSADPELTPDKNGLLPHSKLGGNIGSPLYVGGFSRRMWAA